jgi:hypothetical protein
MGSRFCLLWPRPKKKKVIVGNLELNSSPPVTKQRGTFLQMRPYPRFWGERSPFVTFKKANRNVSVRANGRAIREEPRAFEVITRPCGFFPVIFQRRFARTPFSSSSTRSCCAAYLRYVARETLLFAN